MALLFPLSFLRSSGLWCLGILLLWSSLISVLWIPDTTNHTNVLNVPSPSADSAVSFQNALDRDPSKPVKKKSLESKPPYFYDNDCQVWQTSKALPRNHRNGRPNGLVVTVVVSNDADSIRRICHALPTQFFKFVIPQGLDMLLVFDDVHTMEFLLECLPLAPRQQAAQQWSNLDGSQLNTTECTIVSNATALSRFFLAVTEIAAPDYTKGWTRQWIDPPQCRADFAYIQATRWYTNEMLHLRILQDYDYWVKLDTDVFFTKQISFFLLADLHPAILGHTARYPQGSATCASGIQQAIADFQSETNQTWCSPSRIVQRDRDEFFTNFLVGRVEFWQSPPVLKLARFLTNYPNGFFRRRWTDQIFWHFAVGLYLARAESWVVDYTDLRCMPKANCWMSSYNPKFGPRPWNDCSNEGYFLHTKDYGQLRLSDEAPVAVTQRAHKSTYRHDCS